MHLYQVRSDVYKAKRFFRGNERVRAVLHQIIRNVQLKMLNSSRKTQM